MNTPKLLIAYYSAFGHTHALAEAVGRGARQADGGAEVRLRRAAELPVVAEAMSGNDAYAAAQRRMADVAEVSHDDLRWADAIAWGTPTRYGNMCAQMKAFVDSTGSLWQDGELEDKPAGVFVSTSTQHGGQESTALTFHVPLLHLGMVIVGSPYGQNANLFTDDELAGGSPYGPGTIAGGSNQREPRAGDLAQAESLGARLVRVGARMRPLRTGDARE